MCLIFQIKENKKSYKYKRIELSGNLLYELFLEYYKIQIKNIRTEIDKKYTYHRDRYFNDIYSLIELNYNEFFSIRTTEEGIKKAFKGNWGAHSYTKKMGIVHLYNRISKHNQ